MEPSTDQSKKVALLWTPSEEDEERASHNKAELKFSIDFSSESEPLEGTITDAISFFMQETTRDLLLSSGGEQKIEEYELTPELERIWKESCQHFQTNHDNFAEYNGCLLSGHFEATFPGVHLCNTILNGVQLVVDDTAMPVYETHTLAENHESRGLLAWLFDRATGNASIPRGYFFRTGTIAMSKTTIVDHGDDQFAFSSNIRLDVTIAFPAILLRLSPFSKSKAEEFGRNSCQRSITKMMGKSLKNTRAEYHRYLESKTLDKDDQVIQTTTPVGVKELYTSSY